jgi:guanylate kinase
MPVKAQRHDNRHQGEGLLFVVAAPSGAGKTSLVRELIASTRGLVLSVSHTTRPKRPGERDGEDYHFVDRPAFDQMVSEGVMLEYADVFDHRYGTSRDWVLEQLGGGLDVVLEIDWQGAEQVRGGDVTSVGIQIIPPSLQALEARLRARGQDSDAIIGRRMRDAKRELKNYHKFDYVVLNDDFATALSVLQAIVTAERSKTRIQATRLAEVLDQLLA